MIQRPIFSSFITVRKHGSSFQVVLKKLSEDQAPPIRFKVIEAFEQLEDAVRAADQYARDLLVHYVEKDKSAISVVAIQNQTFGQGVSKSYVAVEILANDQFLQKGGGYPDSFGTALKASVIAAQENLTFIPVRTTPPIYFNEWYTENGSKLGF